MNRLPRFPFLLLVALALVAAGVATTSGAARADEASPAATDAGVGHDVLALERARLRHPMDGDVRAQLAAARDAAGLPGSRPSLVKRVTGIVSLDLWAVLGGVALAVLALLFLQRGLHPWLVRRGWSVSEIPRRAFHRVVLGATLCVLVGGAALALHLPDAKAWVVTTGPAHLRISPFAEAASTAALPVGSTVHVERAFGDHVYVRDPQGRAGWVGRDHVEAIAPNISEL